MTRPLHVTVPTLGTRPTLYRSLASLLPISEGIHLEVRSPREPEFDLRPLLEQFPSSECVVSPDNGQHDAILQSWRAATSPWVTWLNDDDLVLPAAAKVLLALGTSPEPEVVYGDLLIGFEHATRLVRLPDPMRPMYLRWGRDYVPGVLPCLNGAAREILFQLPTVSGHSFDYEWWLALAGRARFTNVGAATTMWVHAADAKTVATAHIGAGETGRLKERYAPKSIIPLTTTVARSAAKLSVLTRVLRGR